MWSACVVNLWIMALLYLLLSAVSGLEQTNILKKWLLDADLWLSFGQLEHYLRLSSTWFWLSRANRHRKCARNANFVKVVPGACAKKKNWHTSCVIPLMIASIAHTGPWSVTTCHWDDKTLYLKFWWIFFFFLLHFFLSLVCQILYWQNFAYKFAKMSYLLNPVPYMTCDMIWYDFICTKSWP